MKFFFININKLFFIFSIVFKTAAPLISVEAEAAEGEEGADKNPILCKEYVDYIESLATDDQKTVWEDYGQFEWEYKDEDDYNKEWAEAEF